ncbi:MAG: HAMP domain-containing histidine kinase, partial [Oscillospiraceae bacterium]|nr:HAMP domain-containing histidine kinase [Oscillospiraceae bacterium]
RNVGISVLVGLVLIALVILTGSLYIASLKRPIDAIGDTAKLVAAGQFDTRIDNIYSGEFGELCDIVNDMASELQRTNNLKNDFVSSISHELRTPLTSIKGWSDTISNVSTDDELYQRGLNIISSETERLSGLVEDLLDFSRLESKRKLSYDPVMLDLGAELSDAVLTLEQRAQKLGIIVKYSEPDYPVIVDADKNRLRQVFTNVFDNALKYSSRKKAITVRLATEEDSAVISVKDRGPGIPADEIPRVTERYYRASNSVYGTGIGLSLVDEIMRSHGGTVRIESELGHGTTVFLTLPLHKAVQPFPEQ